MEIYKTVNVVRLSDGAECSVPEHELKENPELYKVAGKSTGGSGSGAAKPKPKPASRGKGR